MKPAAALLSALLAAVALAAQPSSPRQDRALLAELNRAIWTPYTEAFARQSADGYLALLAPDFVRIEGDQQVIRPLAEHIVRVRRSFQDWEARDLRPEFQFRFTERIVRGGLASERGVFQFVLSDPEGNTERWFGTFHVLARKVGERWLVTAEYDTSNGETVTPADFQRAAPPEDFNRF